MARTIEADYLVVGAGAVGMAFIDAVVHHADVRVALVDQRHAPGGHWLAAYPFVQLHLASEFYGVASTPMGGNQQQAGPESGLPERAGRAEILAYYARVLTELEASGRVSFFPCCRYAPDRSFISRITGEHFAVTESCRIVDSTYLSPGIPAESGPSFEVEPDAKVVSVNDLAALEEPARTYVIVGAGKTATDAIIWLLAQGLDPGAITWVRPREPWMFNRLAVQPYPESYLGMNADIMEAAATAKTLDEVFFRLEAAGVMLRIDPSHTPTMARTPTLGTWELERLRSVEHVVRRGHLRGVEPRRLTFDEGSLSIGPNALVINCAGEGMRLRPPLPIWQPDVVVPQVVQAGLPCFSAALVGFVEATREHDRDKNRVCLPSSYGDTLADWARMIIRGSRANVAMHAVPDISQWANAQPLYGARIPPGYQGSPKLEGILTRLVENFRPGVARLTELAASG